MTRILVTGATGSTGLATVHALQGCAAEVRVLVHNDDARADPLHRLGVDVVTGDLLDINCLVSAMDGVDTAYFVYPVHPRLIDATAYFAQAATEAGVSAIVNMSQRPARREAKSHASLNHWIAERIFDRAGVAVTHLRSNLFADWLLYAGQVNRVVETNVLALPFGNARFAPISSQDQGRVIAAVLTDPTPHAGKVYYIDGPKVMTGRAIAESMSDALQRSITYYPIPIADFQAIVTQIPYLSTFFAQHIGAVADDLEHGVFDVASTTVGEITGVTAMDIPDFIRLHRDEFTPQQPVAGMA